MPSAIWMARRLREGMPLEDICNQFERQVKTVVQRLNHAGFGSDGVPQTLHPVARVLKPWRVIPRFMDQAACAEADPGLFFPNWGQEEDRGNTARAKEICKGCDVRAQCLAYALANHERYGVWGGMTTGQRRALETKKTA